LIYVLDTNVISALRRPDRAPAVTAWIRQKPEDDLYLSAITIGEIARGIAQQQRANPDFARDLATWLDRTLRVFSDRILPFGAQDARIWGRLSHEIGHTGADLMIAATALAHDAAVVTRNVADFAPTGVRVENPFA